MKSYKVGDRVVVDKSNIDSSSFNNHGVTGVIISLIESDIPDNNYPYYIKLDNGYTLWCTVLGYACEIQKIVITTDGETTTARLYKNNECVKKAEAKCCPEDTFDFNVGAKLAFDRLIGVPMGSKKKETPKYYNGKVVCIKTAYSWWTVGKIYTVTDGVIIANNGQNYPGDYYEPYRDADDIRHAGRANDTKHNPKNEFIPLVED